MVAEKSGELVEDLAVGEHQMYTFGRSLTCDFTLEHPSASRQHAVLVHHENGGIYIVDLKSSHGTFVNDKLLTPFEACRLREHGVVRFGASTRTYTLALKPAITHAPSLQEEDEIAEVGNKRAFEPPMHTKKW